MSVLSSFVPCPLLLSSLLSSHFSWLKPVFSPWQDLRLKASFRNPDEFYFKMQNSRTKGGVHLQPNLRCLPLPAHTTTMGPCRAFKCEPGVHSTVTHASTCASGGFLLCVAIRSSHHGFDFFFFLIAFS